MDGEADLLVGGDKGVCCSPPSTPKPRGFSQALQKPPTQICSQTFPAVWDAEIDSSIHSVTKYFFENPVLARHRAVLGLQQRAR